MQYIPEEYLYILPPFLAIAFQSSEWQPSLPFEVRCESGIY